MGSPQFDVNLFDPAIVADPFPIYEEIRATGPVVWNASLSGWMVTGFEDCMEIHRTAGDKFGQLLTAAVTPWFEGPTMISVDAAEHTRLRKCLSPYFTRQAITTWEARVKEVVDDLVEPLVRDGRFDIVSDFTLIPTVIVAEMMGIPKDRTDDFRRWSHTIISNLSYGREDPAVFQMMRDIGAEANGYLGGEVERHREEELDDLITAMVQMSEMTEAEIRATVLLLVLAGYDTTAKLLANSLVALAEYPEQRAELVADPSLIPNAIEEILRWQGISHVTPRMVLQDTVLGGVELSVDERVYVLKGAANRDPERWDAPDQLDIHREPKSHLGFGFGAHLCLGAPLARLEVKAALERLLELAPVYEVYDVDYGTGMAVRGAEHGYVEVTRAPV